jgi:thiol-disulfide isomerase/thioredoxin
MNLILKIFLPILALLAFKKDKSKVYIAMYEDCPVCIYMTKSLKDLQEEYGKDYDFILVFPNQLSNYKTMVLFKEKYELHNFKLVLDEDQSLSKKLNLKVTPEALIENSKGEIIYKGRINDAYVKIGKRRYSIQEHTLKNYLNGTFKSRSEEEWPKAVGCYITFNN